MTYATAQDLVDRIPERDLQLLTDFSGAANAVDARKITDALEDATAQINSYIAKVVTLPLAETPAMLSVVCRDLARYRLYANIGRVTETETKLHDAAVAYLRSVRDGAASIGDETAENTVEASEGAVSVEGPDRVMTRDSLQSF